MPRVRLILWQSDDAAAVTKSNFNGFKVSSDPTKPPAITLPEVRGEIYLHACS
jgi:hypothetical protein